MILPQMSEELLLDILSLLISDFVPLVAASSFAARQLSPRSGLLSCFVLKMGFVLDDGPPDLIVKVSRPRISFKPHRQPEDVADRSIESNEG